jgi:uncharacterized membrane protein
MLNKVSVKQLMNAVEGLGGRANVFMGSLIKLIFFILFQAMCQIGGQTFTMD